MVQLRPAWNVGFELHPVETLNILPHIGINEGMQFTIGHAIEYPSVSANVLYGFWQLNAHPGIVSRSYDISFYFALRCTVLCGKRSAGESQDCDGFEQSLPISETYVIL